MFKSYCLLKAGSRQNMFWSEGMEVRDYLNDYLKNYSLKYNKKEPNYFILDSHENLKTYHPSNREDRDFEYYCYSRSFYNKVSKGDIFLYRRPKKATKNRIFYIFGGGVVIDILPLDQENNVKIIVGYGFKFVESINETSDFLKSFAWTSKKKGQTWRNFWAQYGMNQINSTDFWNLVKRRDCVAIENCTRATDVTTMRNLPKKNISLLKDQVFSIFVTDDYGNVTVGDIVMRLDCESKSLAEFIEYLVLEFEKNELCRLCRPDLSALVKTEASNCGYDIYSMDINGTPKRINIKYVMHNKIDGFEMTALEMNSANKMKQEYCIYRIYNLNLEKRSCNLKIFRWNINETAFTIEPIKYRLLLK